MLANEQVVDGCCWRHEDTPVEQRALEQWFLSITAYADELLRRHRASWKAAGRSACSPCSATGSAGREGAEVDFTLEGYGEPIRVFTTRVDTIYGATCVILAPEHPLIETLLDAELQGARQGDDRRARAARIPAISRRKASFTGHYAVNPYSGEQVPIWVGNFVLMGYGTGAIMAVPAHDERDFEFCTKYGIADPPGDPAGGWRTGRCRRP